MSHIGNVEIRQTLPQHRIPEAKRDAAGRPAIRIDGLVNRPRTVRPEDLQGLPRIGLAEPFTCEEGWQVQHLAWRGVRLLDVLALAEPREEAEWVRVSSGAYAVPLSLATPEQALLALELNGEPLSLEHGGPWRLVMPGAACFGSVKWVDRLELAAEPGEASGEVIARARLANSG